MPGRERRSVVKLVAATGILCYLLPGEPTLARADERSDWKRPFAPDEHTALEQYAWTAQHLVVVALRDVRTRLSVLTPGPEGWSRREVDLGDRPTSTSVIDTDPMTMEGTWTASA